MIPEIEYYKLASKDLKKLREMKYEMEMTKSQNTKNEQQKDLCVTVEQQVWVSIIHRSMVLQAENEQLKELLKECKIPLEVYNEMFGNKEELLTKIDEVLK